MAREKSIHPLVAALVLAPLLLAATPAAQLAEAVAAQRALVAEQPGNAGALNDLGNLLVETGELDEAEEAYRRALEIEPGLPEPQYNLALLLAADDRRREARRMLQALLAEHPGHAWARYQLGTLHQASGNRGRALRSFREAFRLDPSLSDPRHNPRVLDNNLATAAMLEAFSLSAPAVTNRHIYVDPARMQQLLLPPLTLEPAEPMEEPETGAEAAETPTAETPAETEGTKEPQG